VGEYTFFYGKGNGNNELCTGQHITEYYTLNTIEETNVNPVINFLNKLYQLVPWVCVT
jgi:hypothetical protein